MLCPYALDLIWHGSTPLWIVSYPTAEETKRSHDELVRLVKKIVESFNIKIINDFIEYEHEIGFTKDDESICAKSKADLVYTIKIGRSLINIYIEVSSVRINPAKPWQALLRGMGIYYEWRIPTGIVIISPQRIIYKLIEKPDQEAILFRINRSSYDFKPRADLCSLCELASYCPYRTV